MKQFPHQGWERTGGQITSSPTGTSPFTLFGLMKHDFSSRNSFTKLRYIRKHTPGTYFLMYQPKDI